MKLIDTIELLTEILVGKKEETRSQKKIRTTDVKTKGKTATPARNIEPGSVTLVKILSINSAVFFPGRTPGMKPPCCFIFDAT